MNDDQLDLGRFAEPSLYILASLTEGPKHGYAIMTDVETITGKAMGPGTLYGALARLERRGLIEALEPVERRRPYRLTDGCDPWRHTAALCLTLTAARHRYPRWF